MTTFKFAISVLSVWTLLTPPLAAQASWLGDKCVESSDCKTSLAECDKAHKVCVCQPYSVEANATTCLPGTLLGFKCEADAQCAVKVPSSGCVNGVCACGSGFVPYRRHTCLSPSRVGEVCFENDQCALADRGSFCKYVVPKVFGRCQCQSGRQLNGGNRCSASVGTKIGEHCQEDNDCSMANAYCQRKLDGSSVCTCDIAFAPAADQRRCLPTYRGLLSATSLGYPCYAHLQCQLADPNSICNSEGICDCADAESSNSTCNARMSTCHKHTFQCRSDGKCISWYFVCDGKSDCEDESDENCNLEDGMECPSQAFQCGRTNQTSQRGVSCISRSKICDGIRDCEDGSDEFSCKEGKGKCPPGSFQCSKTKECLPEHQFCNAIADCKDVSDEDELKCRTEFQPSDYCPFRCKNGLCRSSAIVCSGVDGCGDNSDEEECQACRCPRRESQQPQLERNRG